MPPPHTQKKKSLEGLQMCAYFFNCHLSVVHYCKLNIELQKLDTLTEGKASVHLTSSVACSVTKVNNIFKL
jgi:hypothetical protein